jgi:hypothetical protein
MPSATGTVAFGVSLALVGFLACKSTKFSAASVALEPQRIRMQTSAGQSLTVSADGVLHIGSRNGSQPEIFLVVPLDAGFANLLLREKAREVETVDRQQATTRSGCKCIGIVNAHGFGGYCHSWEEQYQAPWCYVGDECPVKRKGSFGLKHERCDQEEIFPGRPEGQDSAPDVSWEAPARCACSGYKNKHGYGAYCKAWEDHLAAGQTPWCYTSANCSASQSRRGSFGHVHVDCEPHYQKTTSPPRPPSPPPPPLPPPPPRPPTAKLSREQKQLRKRQVHEQNASALVALAARDGGYIALIAQSTGGFVAVRPPPHKDAMLAVARDAGISVHSIFAPLKSGHLLALGTRALVGVCAEAATSAPVMCTGYRERAREPHRRFLRSIELPSALKVRMLPLH